MIESVAHLPAAVYRLYDGEDRLLYVGVTHNLEERFRTHKRTKLWWLDVARSEHTWMSSRAEAEKAEALAIETEKPLRDRSRASREGQGIRPMDTAYDNPRRDPYEEQQVAMAASRITASLNCGDLPAWSFLPAVDVLGERLGLATAAADLGRRRLTVGEGATLTHSRYHFIAAPAGSFPSLDARRNGELFVVARHHFGNSAFTARQLVERSRLTIGTVRKGISAMLRNGLLEADRGRDATFRILRGQSD